MLRRVTTVGGRRERPGAVEGANLGAEQGNARRVCLAAQNGAV